MFCPVQEGPLLYGVRNVISLPGLPNTLSSTRKREALHNTVLTQPTCFCALMHFSGGGHLGQSACKACHACWERKKRLYVCLLGYLFQVVGYPVHVGNHAYFWPYARSAGVGRRTRYKRIAAKRTTACC